MEQSVFLIKDGSGQVVEAYSEEWVALKVSYSRAGHSVTKMKIHDAFVQCNEVQETQSGPLTSRLHCLLPAGHTQPAEHEFGQHWKGSPKRG